jgi:NTE family protein
MADRPARTRIALALGSGGARGYAHIGAIQVLDERGFEIVAIAGSSMGALVGGLRAAGKLEEYTEWALGLSQLDVLRLLDPSLSAAGAIRGQKVFAKVGELFDGALIEDLPVPYTAVAADLLARREVWFQSGPIAAAIRASISIPGVFTPVMLNGRLLADGGLMNPVPIAPTVGVHADATVAVSLSGDRRTNDIGPPASETAEERPVEEWGERFRRSASNLFDRDVIRTFMGRFGNRATDDSGDGADDDGVEDLDSVAPDGGVRAGLPHDAEPLFDDLPHGLGKGDVIAQSVEAMQTVLSRYRLAGYPPDVLVTVPRDACRSLDFHRAAEMIELGRAATEEALDAAGLEPTRPQP